MNEHEQMLDAYLKGNNYYSNIHTLKHKCIDLSTQEYPLMRKLIKKAIKTKDSDCIQILTTYICIHKKYHILNIFTDEKIIPGNIFDFVESFTKIIFIKFSEPSKIQEKFYKYIINELLLTFETAGTEEKTFEIFMSLLSNVDKTISKNLFSMLKKKMKKHYLKVFFVEFLTKVIEKLHMDDISFFVDFYSKKLSKFFEMTRIHAQILELFQKILKSEICDKPMELFLTLLPKLCGYIEKLALNYHKYDKKHTGSNEYQSYEVINDQKISYEEILVSIFHEYPHESLDVLVPLFKKGLDIKNLIIFELYANLVSQIEGRGSIDRFIESGIFKLIYESIDVFPKSADTLPYFFETLVERRMFKEMKRISAALIPLAEEYHYFGELTDFLYECQCIDLNDVIDINELLFLILKEIKLDRQDNSFENLVYSLFNCEYLDPENQLLDEIVVYLYSNEFNKIHYLEVLFSGMERNAKKWMNPIFDKMLKTLNVFVQSGQIGQTTTVLSVILEMVKVFEIDSIIENTNFLELLFSFVDEDLEMIEHATSIIIQLCLYNSVVLHKHIFSIPMIEVTTEPVLALCFALEFKYGIKKHKETPRELISKCFNVLSNHYFRMISLSFATFTHFDEVNSTFEKLGKEFYETYISNQEKLYPLLERLVIDAFTTLVLKNLDFSHRVLFPKFDFQNIQQPIQIEMILCEKLHNLVPGIMKFEDIRFNFE
eukprot:gene7792-12266_t